MTTDDSDTDTMGTIRFCCQFFSLDTSGFGLQSHAFLIASVTMSTLPYWSIGLLWLTPPK